MQFIVLSETAFRKCVLFMVSSPWCIFWNCFCSIPRWTSPFTTDEYISLKFALPISLSVFINYYVKHTRRLLQQKSNKSKITGCTPPIRRRYIFYLLLLWNRNVTHWSHCAVHSDPGVPAAGRPTVVPILHGRVLICSNTNWRCGTSANHSMVAQYANAANFILYPEIAEAAARWLIITS